VLNNIVTVFCILGIPSAIRAKLLAAVVSGQSCVSLHAVCEHEENNTYFVAWISHFCSVRFVYCKYYQEYKTYFIFRKCNLYDVISPAELDKKFLAIEQKFAGPKHLEDGTQKMLLLALRSDIGRYYVRTLYYICFLSLEA
jgi:hypothetical protein